MLAARLQFIGARILAPCVRRGKTSSGGDKKFHSLAAPARAWSSMITRARSRD
jgi:hypothetical protein